MSNLVLAPAVALEPPEILARERSAAVESLLPALWTSLRPRQWIKNLACLLPAALSGGADASAVLRALAAALLFTALSSAAYLLNDVADAPLDRRHSLKRLRPICSGRLPQAAALGLSAAIGLSSIALSWLFLRPAAPSLVLYAMLAAAYSARLRGAAFLDVFCIAAGFCLRVTAGAQAASVEASPWILGATFFLSLFMGFGKRYGEIAAEARGHPHGRPAYAGLPARLLDIPMAVAASLAITAYIGFAASEPRLLPSAPFVAFGVIRYLILVKEERGSAFPELLVLSDGASLINGALWLAAAAGRGGPP